MLLFFPSGCSRFKWRCNCDMTWLNLFTLFCYVLSSVLIIVFIVDTWLCVVWSRNLCGFRGLASSPKVGGRGGWYQAQSNQCIKVNNLMYTFHYYSRFNKNKKLPKYLFLSSCFSTNPWAIKIKSKFSVNSLWAFESKQLF